MIKKELSIRELKFVGIYLEINNAAEAAIKAGYSKNGAARTAYRLLKKPKIKKEIENVKKFASEKTGWTREKMLKELEKLKDGAIGGERPNHGAAAKCLEMICKMQGLFEPDKIKLEGDIGVEVRNSISFAELQENAEDNSD